MWTGYNHSALVDGINIHRIVISAGYDTVVPSVTSCSFCLNILLIHSPEIPQEGQVWGLSVSFKLDLCSIFVTVLLNLICTVKSLI